MMQDIIFGLNEIEEAAKTFLSYTKPYKVIAFHGGMGAGKTTLIGELCKQLKVAEYVSSPTFSIINEYEGENNNLIYHFDFYRIEEMEELLGIGITEYLDSGAYCFIEWPEIGAAILPDDTLHVEISETEDGKRKITFR